ncbi:AbrB/MazE/SpoVT family DNA-binding domain-containing protein [Jiella sp. MQZ9-1]|uniref:AbrB/MazE/SpoVT family DNA-binding domain-containing protein n=1 Tax=Jiella flava TaxID=2816857 RepID=A0A939G228_9HYPH|nr:AbrB/MazE/SpoVT family DNA-binding domain-containing protein [Jiella flava]MBO0664465.1 AbrB/MazE/SpoVT family DNA-binding domain-containing protein [Jiella flava]MCD2473101.1 AbrB/MazE/SpoVT family DNA-binding domain-containing protein [Jiella flava]
MTMPTIDDKGVVTLDDTLLELLGGHRGEEIEAVRDAGGGVVLKAKTLTETAPTPAPAPSGRLEDVFSSLKRYYDGPPISIDEINEIIADAWAGKR